MVVLTYAQYLYIYINVYVCFMIFQERFQDLLIARKNNNEKNKLRILLSLFGMNDQREN